MLRLLIKTIIILLLVGCLFDVPYGYFQFVRFGCCAGFVYLAKIYEDEKQHGSFLLCAAFVILFNPIFKIHFTRKVWNGIDIAVAALLLGWVLLEALRRKENKINSIK